MDLEIVDLGVLRRGWWIALLRGLASLVFGVLVLLVPNLSLKVLVFAWGVYAVVEGAMLIAAAFMRRSARAPSWLLTLQGALSIAAGIAAFVWPGLTAVALLYLVSAWLLFVGVLEIAEAIRLRKTVDGEWLLALRGVGSLAFGVLLALFPGVGLITLLAWIGAFSLFVGAALIALAFRIRPSSSGRWSGPSRLAQG